MRNARHFWFKSVLVFKAVCRGFCITLLTP
ncbi:DUF3265 domain-containing protein [Vibrio alginolyticus]|nr:DUF3265 domain-containing protein [Vibrio alginolyticus]